MMQAIDGPTSTWRGTAMCESGVPRETLSVARWSCAPRLAESCSTDLCSMQTNSRGAGHKTTALRGGLGFPAIRRKSAQALPGWTRSYASAFCS
jgi:hypothetical protein